MYKDLLPNGSIVKLSGGDHYVMICGRVTVPAGEETIYDYVGCLYPEGLTDMENMLFFNRDNIETILFIGYQDKQELEYRSEILDNLGELTIKDGELVDVNEA